MDRELEDAAEVRGPVPEQYSFLRLRPITGLSLLRVPGNLDLQLLQGSTYIRFLSTMWSQACDDMCEGYRPLVIYVLQHKWIDILSEVSRPSEELVCNSVDNHSHSHVNHTCLQTSHLQGRALLMKPLRTPWTSFVPFMGMKQAQHTQDM